MEELEQRLAYRFRDPALLALALTHPSAAGESHVHNQRLEFLGDAVLQLSMSVRLYQQYPKMQEGQLSRLRARCVQEKSLVVAAQTLRLGDFLKLGNGEESAGGREKPSILADAMEAVLGAMYLDGGMEVAAALIERVVPVGDLPQVRDYKTEFQELVQRVTGVTPVYRIVAEEGPPHDRRFTAQVLLGDKPAGVGEGGSKKQAEQAAAQAALRKQGIT